MPDTGTFRFFLLKTALKGPDSWNLICMYIKQGAWPNIQEFPPKMGIPEQINNKQGENYEKFHKTKRREHEKAESHKKKKREHEKAKSHKKQQNKRRIL